VIVLAGDVGGTNARLAIVELNGRSAHIARERRYSSRDYPGLTPIVHRFCEEAATSHPSRACFGVACAVVGGECRAPNLPWTINARKLATDIGIPSTALINDFVAVGYGIELLSPSDLETIQAGIPTPQDVRDSLAHSGARDHEPQRGCAGRSGRGRSGKSVKSEK
jgi:glucokinase